MHSPNMRPLHPRQSLRRLKRVFGPSLSLSSSSSSPAQSPSSTSSESPLSASPASSVPMSDFSIGRNLSAASLSSPGGASSSVQRVIRRKKSMVEVEQEEERSFDGALVGLVEPRPYAGPTLGGIEEVLDGRI